MTTHTYRRFECSQGHKGVEKTSENDQPYSKCWESITISGVKASGKDNTGYNNYVCETCGNPMVEI